MRAAASQTSPPYSFHAGAPVRSGVVNASTARGQVLTSICVVLSPVFVTVTTVWTVIGVVCEMVLRASKLRCRGPVELEHDAPPPPTASILQTWSCDLLRWVYPHYHAYHRGAN